MRSVFAIGILSSIIERPATVAPDVELEPMRPGAWAEWAKAYRSTPAAATRRDAPAGAAPSAHSGSSRLATGRHHG